MSYRVNAEKLNQIVRIYNVASGFRHFICAEKKPRVTEHLLRQRLAESHEQGIHGKETTPFLLAQSHEHNRPVDCVESYNILTYDVNIGRPVFFIKLTRAVRVVSERGYIV